MVYVRIQSLIEVTFLLAASVFSFFLFLMAMWIFVLLAITLGMGVQSFVANILAMSVLVTLRTPLGPVLLLIAIVAIPLGVAFRFYARNATDRSSAEGATWLAVATVILFGTLSFLTSGFGA